MLPFCFLFFLKLKVKFEFSHRKDKKIRWRMTKIDEMEIKKIRVRILDGLSEVEEEDNIISCIFLF